MTELKRVTHEDFTEKVSTPHHLYSSNIALVISKGSTHLIIEDFKMKNGDSVNCAGMEVEMGEWNFEAAVLIRDNVYALRSLSTDFPHDYEERREMTLKFPEGSSEEAQG